MYELLSKYGLWAVFFGTMIEGDLTLLLAGVLARAGLFSFEEAFLVGTAGGLVGDSLSYLIGARFRNRARTLKLFIRARGRIEKLMSRFGVLSVFIVKYVYGLRTASAIFWGLAQFGYLKFAALTLASCAVWVGLLAGLGFTFATGVQTLIGDLHRIQIILLIVLIIVATVYVISRFERQVIEEEKPFFAETEEEKEMIERGKEVLHKAITHVHLPGHHADDTEKPAAREKTTREDG
ncbi:MAG TPA: DedA family protein [Blastocatellia bacterium]|nr:DedA family protein [Blastocatellia bacterium]